MLRTSQRWWERGQQRGKTNRGRKKTHCVRVERLEDRLVLSSLQILDQTSMAGTATAELVSGIVDPDLDYVPTITGSIDGDGVPIPPTPTMPGVPGAFFTANVFSKDPTNGGGGVIAFGQSSIGLVMVPKPDAALYAGELTLQMVALLSCQQGSTGWYGSASYDGGSSLGHDEPVTVKINPGPSEEAGAPVQVKLTALASGSNGSYNAGYSLASGSGELLNGNYRGGLTDQNTVTVSAKIGDTFQIHFHTQGTASTAAGDSQVLTYKMEVQPGAAVDLIAKSLTWDTTKGGVNFSYQVDGDDLKEDAKVALYWAKGPRFEDHLGEPLFTAPVEKSKGPHGPIAVASNYLVDLPYSLDPPKLDATHLIVVLDPDNVVDEKDENNNVQALELRQVIAGKDFKTEFTRKDGTTFRLKRTLLEKMMKLASYAVANNLVTGNIVLSEGVRDPRVAHRWSTSWSIRNGLVPLANLRKLKATNGKDLDGNLWYNPAWERGLPHDKKGNLTARGLALLWKKIRDNAWKKDDRKSGRGNVAAEGYPVGDPYRAPNAYKPVSKHCSGDAMDVFFPWRKGAKMDGVPITSGDQKDKAVNNLIKSFGLRRPVTKPTPEKDHFEDIL